MGRRERTIAIAEAMKLDLSQQLRESQKELERSVTKFQRFAEGADVGIFILGLDGVYSYRNPAWFNICDPDHDEFDLDKAWEEIVDDEYSPVGQAKFAELVATKQLQYVIRGSF